MNLWDCFHLIRTSFLPRSSPLPREISKLYWNTLYTSAKERKFLSFPSVKRNSLTSSFELSNYIDSYRVWLKSKRDSRKPYCNWVSRISCFAWEIRTPYIGAREDTPGHMLLLLLAKCGVVSGFESTKRRHVCAVGALISRARDLLFAFIIQDLSGRALYLSRTTWNFLCDLFQCRRRHHRHRHRDFSTFPRCQWNVAN